jgi:Spy/CpxP family protein refolding chaperone
MNEPNRRGFLALAGAGAAAVGAVAVAPAAEASTSVPSHVKEPLVAYVRDAKSGEVAVMIGEREVVVHDRELAARIARAAS